MERNTLNEAKIYVGTYRKYNEGSLDGDWLDLLDYSDKDEFYEACAELHSDEDDPEFMFQDRENIPSTLIGESWLSDNFFEIRDAMDKLDSEQQEAFMIWCNNGHHDIAEEDIDDLISIFEDEYQGTFDSEEAFAESIVDERHDLSDFARQYFDYESYARDIFCGDYWYDGGYVFCAS